MVTASLFLVLALVSYTVVAQPGEKGLTSPPACLNPLETSETSTKSVYEWIPLDEEILLPTSNEDPVEIGLSYILQKLNLQSNKFKVMTNFTDYSGTTHMYGVPLHKGLPIGNLNAAAHVKNSRTFFYSATIKNNPRLTKRSPTTPDSTFKKSYKEAVKAAVDCLGVPFYPDIAPVMESHWMRDGSIIPVWGFQLKNNPITRWFEVKVNAIISDIVSMEDFKREFTYTAIELPNENPRNGFSTILSPENFQASPNGWTDGFELKGNNAEAKYKKYKTFKTTTKGMLSGAFDPLLPPQTPKNIVAGAANAFYAFTCSSSLVTNMVHDALYQYGFTEPAGNFQQNNFNKGGIGGDLIIINIQKSDKENTASFHTPPDGQYGVLNLHIYIYCSKPSRDSALDNTILTHELTHGLSSRLTGGALEIMCMTKIEPLGLSEGYSDMMALIFTAKPEDTRNTEKVIGEYVKGNSRGMHPTMDSELKTLRTSGDSASLQKYVTRQLLDTSGFFKDPSFDQSRAHGTRYLMLARMDALWTARKAIQIGILVDTHPFSVDHCILCDQQLLSTSIAHLVVECEQVTDHRIQSGLVPAIKKSRLRLLGCALDPGVENVYTWLRGGVLNGEADLDQLLVGRDCGA
ncbi:hypothetical protein BASA50_010318 [Batrachochytrium salamandrivorans]|uniref:Extracellular metalloproteinase n=1 Tax=Batrachochytrium salamandrivorans TaxID=1357716 RepID=A0ABQ8EZD6_9FUNG|nr:hypothetical protein BASA50_010318 [Batrachochytrium salamandrivorans]